MIFQRLKTSVQRMLGWAAKSSAKGSLAARRNASRWVTLSMPSDLLSMQTIRYARQQYYLGIMSQTQWLWEQMEGLDDALSTAIENSESIFKQFEFYVETVSTDDDADAALAESQAELVQEYLDSVVNMEEGLLELAAARRFGYTVLQLVEDDDAVYLESVPRWQICRDNYMGDLMWNPSGAATYMGEQWPEDVQLVMMEDKKPLHLKTMTLVLNRVNALAQWNVFNNRYGTPGVFITGPEGLSDDMADAYAEQADLIASDSSGYLPHGSDVKVVAPPTASVDIYERLYVSMTDAIQRLVVGSTLTSMSVSGSGTLAGNAHETTANNRAESTVHAVCAVLDEQLVKPLVAHHFEGSDCLVKLAVRKEAVEGAEKAIANVAALATAGYAVDLDQIEELTGYKVTRRTDIMNTYEQKAIGYRPTEEEIERVQGRDIEPLPEELLPKVEAKQFNTRRRYSDLMLLSRNVAAGISDPVTRTRYRTRMNSLARRVKEHESRIAPLSSQELGEFEAIAKMTLSDMPIDEDAASAKFALERALMPDR